LKYGCATNVIIEKKNFENPGTKLKIINIRKIPPKPIERKRYAAASGNAFASTCEPSSGGIGIILNRASVTFRKMPA
jgi:hypothetical protein